MATQTEIIARQEVAVTKLEQDQTRLALFIHGTAQQTVATTGGTLPTLAGLIEEIRQRAGFRRDETAFAVESLLRYENRVEALYRRVNTKKLYFDPNLAGSYFKLAGAPSGGPIRFVLNIGANVYTITFAAGQRDGVVTGVNNVRSIDPGSTISFYLDTTALAAYGLYMTLVARLEDPAAT